jgi:hypothetical protein
MLSGKELVWGSAVWWADRASSCCSTAPQPGPGGCGSFPPSLLHHWGQDAQQCLHVSGLAWHEAHLPWPKVSRDFQSQMYRYSKVFMFHALLDMKLIFLDQRSVGTFSTDVPIQQSLHVSCFAWYEAHLPWLKEQCHEIVFWATARFKATVAEVGHP